MRELDGLISIEGVAEALWQTINGVDGSKMEAYHAWRALSPAEKEPWFARAAVAIEDWKISTGLAKQTPVRSG